MISVVHVEVGRQEVYADARPLPPAMDPGECPPQTDTRYACAESLKRLLVVQVDMPRPSLVREVRTIIAILVASLLCAHIPRRYGG